MATQTPEFRPEATVADATSLPLLLLLLADAADAAGAADAADAAEEPPELLLCGCPCRLGGHVVNPEAADALANSIRVANL